MDAGAGADVCPECDAVNPWVYENDEYNCQHCGHVRKGSLANKFRDEHEYVVPLTEVFLKNPVYSRAGQSSSDRPVSAFKKKSESELYQQLFGCVRNALNLPELIAHRAWNISELMRKTHNKLTITPAVKNLAMATALVAAREAGHRVSDVTVAVMIEKDVVSVQNDVQMICKTLGRPYADYKGVNDFALKVIQAADDTARLFIDATTLDDDVTRDRFFKNTQCFCAAYQPHLGEVYNIAERVERLAEITGVWHNRSRDYCTVASVFIGLEMAGRMYHHRTRLFTEELGKHISCKSTSWQPRVRELQRVSMDLAFYLPQIGKARIVPELLEPWRGRMARCVPMGQVFILLLPDVLDNMDALWEKRQQELDMEDGTKPKRDVEARLKEALAAFLPAVEDTKTPAATPDSSSVQDSDTVSMQRELLEDDGSGFSNPRGSAHSIPHGNQSSSPCRSLSVPLISSGSHQRQTVQVGPMQKHSRSSSLPPDSAGQTALNSNAIPTATVGGSTAPAMSTNGDLLLPKDRKRKVSDLADGGDGKRPDKRRREYRLMKDPAKERRVKVERLEKFEKLLTAKQVNERSRQQTQQEVGIGVKNIDPVKSGRLVYGKRRHGSRETGNVRRLPAILRLLKEWQTRELGSEFQESDDLKAFINIRGQSDAWLLRRDLRNGRDPSKIPTYRFPTSISMAKAMLDDADIDCPTLGAADDALFNEGELEGYFGDDAFQKARLELWNSQGLDKYVKKNSVYSQRAVEIATKRDPRVADLAGEKKVPVEKLNSARLAEVMASFGEEGEPIFEIDPILQKEFGRSLAHAAIQASGADDYDHDYDKNDEDDGDENGDKEERKEDDDDMNVPMESGNEDCFEVVGDLYDFDVSGYAGSDGGSVCGDYW